MLEAILDWIIPEVSMIEAFFGFGVLVAAVVYLWVKDLKVRAENQDDDPDGWFR